MKRPPSPSSRTKPRHKHIKIPTPDYLANVALYYLGRFAASEASLRRVLDNRLRRAALAHPAFAADMAARENLRCVIDSLVEHYKRLGVLNDESYAAMKTASMRRAGRSTRRIAQHLQQKGIAATVVESALTSQNEDSPETAEHAAATAFARRRKLGPYRADERNPKNLSSLERARKDFAAMARAGFTYDVTRDVLGHLDEDA